MKDSDACVKAARLIDSREMRWSCDAIDACLGQNYGSLRREYGYLFKPKGRTYFGELWGLDFSDDYEQRKQCRVLALLFMAAICESEGR